MADASLRSGGWVVLRVPAIRSGCLVAPSRPACFVDRYPTSILRRARRAAVAGTFFLCAPLAVAEEGAIQGPGPVRPSADGLPLVAAQSWTLPQVIVTPPAAKKNPNSPP